MMESRNEYLGRLSYYWRIVRLALVISYMVESMKHLMKSRALIRSILRDARYTESVIVLVYQDGDQLNESQLERDILDAVFGVDESQIVIVDMYTRRTLGTLSIVLDYDSEPCEIIQDYSANDYTQNLVYKAESKI
jgi:hypothetical protein